MHEWLSDPNAFETLKPITDGDLKCTSIESNIQQDFPYLCNRSVFLFFFPDGIVQRKPFLKSSKYDSLYSEDKSYEITSMKKIGEIITILIEPNKL